MTEVTERVARLEGAYNHLATKEDMAKLRAATKADIAELKAATKEDIAELKAATQADIAELKAATQADIAELKAATQADIAELKVATKEDMQALNADLTKKIGTVEQEIAGLKGSAKTLAIAISVGLVVVQLILKYALP